MGSPSAAPPPPPIELPVWTRVLGWLGVVGLIYLLICAVGIISRGFRGLGGDAAVTYLITVFIVAPALVIALVAVI
jgi:solute carrier family 34 (sodium-dependent phosphate cotransporter)